MSKNKNSIFVLVGILLAGGALGGVTLQTLNKGTAKVVVPSVEIKAGETFSSENLTTVDLPKNAVLDGLTIVNTDDIIGKVAVTNISKGEMITENRVVDTKSQGYIANMDKPDTDYGIQLSVDDSSPIEGLNIGDYVAVFTSMDGNSNGNEQQNSSNKGAGRIGDKYKVIGINADADSGKVSNVTIEVSPELASKVAYATSNNNVILTFVDSKQGVTNVPGIDQTRLYQEIIK